VANDAAVTKKDPASFMNDATVCKDLYQEENGDYMQRESCRFLITTQ
jgi:hypothetical protein